MGRAKKTSVASPYDMPFPIRLRHLLDRKGETQEKLAKAIGANRQSIGQWKDGITSPDVNAVVKIAKYYDVFADYLLGISNNELNVESIQITCKKTGLTDAAVATIIDLTNVEAKNILSSLISNEKFLEMIYRLDIINTQIQVYKNYIKMIANEIALERNEDKFDELLLSILKQDDELKFEDLNFLNQDGQMTISSKKYIELLRYSIVKSFEDTLGDITELKIFNNNAISQIKDSLDPNCHGYTEKLERLKFFSVQANLYISGSLTQERRMRDRLKDLGFDPK